MIIKGIKLLKVFTLTPLIISLSYSMNNENNLHNSNQINNNINLQNNNINNQSSNSTNQNELLNRKRKSQHEQDEINDENNIENTINNIGNTFTHTVSFHPSVLTSYAEFYNSELEFNVKYVNKSISLNDVCKMRCYSNFSYQDFIEANNTLKDIIQNISLSAADKDKLTNLNEKQYPILELANFKQNDIEKLQINNHDIINMVCQLKLLKKNTKIARDRLNYIALINEIGLKEYAVQEDQQYKEIYDKMLSIINNVEEYIKSDNFTENYFAELQKFHLINCNYMAKISDDFKIFEELYNKLRVSNNKLEQINIVEQFYSMIVDEKKLFSIFNEILLRDRDTISILDKLSFECWKVQKQYKDITYGGVDLIHQTVLNTRDQYFISKYPSEEIDYKYSKNSNKTQFKNDYDDFFNRIFHSQDLSNSHEAENYLERVFIKPGKNVIDDITRYKRIFEISDYKNGYLLFDNLYKFLKKNLNNINYDLFKQDWVNEEKIIKDHIKSTKIHYSKKYGYQHRK